MKPKFLLLGIATAVMAMSSAVSAANLLAYYPCDSASTATSTPRTAGSGIGGFAANATISTSTLLPYGNKFDAGYFGNAFWETSAAGGGAANANARLTLGTAADPFAATGSFTYALWMYTPSTFAGANGAAQTFILSKFTGNSATGLDFKLMLRSGTAGAGDIQFMTWGGSSVTTLQTTPTLQNMAGGWNHYAITATKPGGVTGTTVTWGLYQNGNPIAFPGGNSTANISTAANGLGLTIGKSAGTANFGYEGVKADEIRFYDNVLTQAEILSIIPEPSAITMLALGGLMLFIRRR